ncbi:MAG TPA: ATPase, partial [Burkholderiales bacterium]|nr:ATPase [Burkholderiales bacterium]
NSLIIAATNHPEILDHALFRRFDDVIEYHLPSLDQAADLIRSRLGKFAPKSFPLKAIAQKAEGLSYAEIRRAVDESIKEAIMHDEGSVKGEALGKALAERRKLSQRLENRKTTSDHAGKTNR